MARPPAQCSLCLLGKELTMCQREDIVLIGGNTKDMNTYKTVINDTILA